MHNTAFVLLVISSFAFCATTIQAVSANRLATNTIEAYAPKIEKQAVAIITEALPNAENGRQAAFLARSMAANVESQYAALSRVVQSQADALAMQSVTWAVVSILALFSYFESRPKALSAV